MQKMKQGRLATDHYFLKASYELKANGLQLSFNIFSKPSTWFTIKNYIKL